MSTTCPLFHPKPSALNAESSLAVMFIARAAHMLAGPSRYDIYKYLQSRVARILTIHLISICNLFTKW